MTVDHDRRPPRLKDVAARAGVSTGTVSHVLNHPDRVTPATVARVRAAIEELGFVRDANASSLARGSTRSVGLVVIDLGNSLFVDVARGAGSRAHQEDLALLVAGSDDDFDLQARNVDTFNEARVAGLILAPMADSSRQVERLRSSGRPTVLVNYLPDSPDVCCATVDNEKAGYIAATHLLQSGCTRLLFVFARRDLQPVAHRRAGVRRAVTSARRAGSAVVYEEAELTDLTEASGRELGESLVARAAPVRPDGVIGVTDILASAVVSALAEGGVAVPADVGVIGCDDNSSAPTTVTTLSTIGMRGRELGDAALELLLDEIAESPDTHAHRRVVFDPVLLRRGSTLG